MKYTSYLSSAKRHSHACQALIEKINILIGQDDRIEERNFLVLSLYYLSGYIVECSLKFKIFEVSNYDENIEISDHKCRILGINYKKDIRIHDFSKLQDFIDSLNIDISYTSGNNDIDILLNNWKPDVRYEHSNLDYESIYKMYQHTVQFLRKM